MSRVRWRVTALAVLVAASSAAVPSLVGTAPDSPAPVVAEAPPRSGTTEPTPPAVATSVAVPAPTPTPSRTPAATPTPARRSSPSPSPIIFHRLVIDAAAKANQGSGVNVIECVTCLSGRRVQYLGQGHTLVVPVRDVPVAGRRTLTIVYTCACADAPRSLDLRVNDDDPHSLPLKGAGSWEDPAKTTLRVDLRRGDNQIVFYNTNDPAPDLDRIEIT